MKKADFTMDFFTKQCYVFLEFYLGCKRKNY